jgi:hypothetical protein
MGNTSPVGTDEWHGRTDGIGACAELEEREREREREKSVASLAAF